MFNLSEQFLNEIICQARWLSLQIIKTFFKAIQLSLLGSITLLIATTRLSSPSFNSHHAITPCFQWQGSVKTFCWNLSGVNAAMPIQSFYVVHCTILTLFVWIGIHNLDIKRVIALRFQNMRCYFLSFTPLLTDRQPQRLHTDQLLLVSLQKIWVQV